MMIVGIKNSESNAKISLAETVKNRGIIGEQRSLQVQWNSEMAMGLQGDELI